jgi:phosphatidate cytidylyltransferase
MLKHRLLFGAVLIAALVGLFYADDALSGSAWSQNAPTILHSVGIVRCDGLLVAVVLLLLVALGTRELGVLFTSAGNTPLRCWPVLVNVILVLIPFVAANGPVGEGDALHAADASWTMTGLVVAFFGAAVFVAARRRTDGAIAAIGASMLMIVYLGLLPQFILRIRVFGPVGATWLLLYFLAAVKFCDIGAYFTGRAIGRTKLIKWLSPGKTIEGLCGGIAASVAFAVAVPILVANLAGPDSSMHGLFPGLGAAALFGLMMAVMGQAGDLLESLIKRDARVKDSAGVIPAFGGLLDILDSPLLTAPIAYAFLVH